jgi:RNA polymerase sigma-70 factor, ECF subfamily
VPGAAGDYRISGGNRPETGRRLRKAGARLGYAQTSDEELMAMVVERRTEAFEALYDRYAGVSYSLALRIVGDRGSAEEVVQDTFVAVWQRAETYNAEYGKLYSWLLRITRNRARDELRRRRPAAAAQGFSPRPPEEVRDTAPGPAEVEEDDARIAEMRSVVSRALEGLPGDQREVLEMAYLQGLSQREISESTGVPLGTVKTRTRLALRKLRQVLGPEVRESVDLDGL